MAEDIYGPSIPHLNRKTVRRNIQHVDPVKITSVPKIILDYYKEVTIFWDLMQINGIGFLNTISRHIMFDTGSMIKNRKIENIADRITWIHKLYLQPGFKITNMHADSKFKSLRRQMSDLGINMNCASKKEHVAEIERFIRTVKECVISTQAAMLFKQISKIMIVHIVASGICWINPFPPLAPVAVLSNTKGPGKLVLGNMVN